MTDASLGFMILIYCVLFIVDKYCLMLCHPHENFTTEEFIKYNGFPYEEHLVEIPNGFISPLQRISHGPSETNNSNRIPVLMFHGLFTSGKMWVAGPRNTSLGYILVDNGYDVWLANGRSCSYTIGFNKRIRDSPKYWDFSFQEQALIDTPVLIDYILNTTGHKKLFYVGMSLGSTIGFILLSTETEYNDKVIAMLGLSPVAYLKYSNNFLLTSAAFIDHMRQQMVGNTGSIQDNLSHQLLLAILPICRRFHAFKPCFDTLMALSGDRLDPEDEVTIPVMLNVISEGTSVKTVNHYWQLHRSGQFRMYDYEVPEENMKIYNQTSPPEFDVTRVTAPVALFPGLFDNLGDPKDIQTLALKLPNLKFNSPLMTNDGDGHFSTVMSRAARYIYSKMIEVMKKIILNPKD